MQCNNRQKLFFILSLLWMAVIFWFSANTGSESSAQSGGIVRLMLHLFFPHYSEWTIHKQELYTHILTLLIRKASHATEYMILSLLFTGCQSWKRSLKRTCLTSWILVVCYAASDEIHQYFVPDRACRATDVLIDSLGAAIGLLLLYLLICCRSKKRLHENNE